MTRRATRGAAALVALGLALQACATQAGAPDEDPVGTVEGAPGTTDDESEPITLALAGDVHFEDELARRLDRAGSTIGPMRATLADADVAMVNLETALTTVDRPAPKEREDPSLRYWFRTPPRALDLLGRSGVDVVSVANNHGADHGRAGLRQAVAADGRGDVAVVGAGRDAAAAYEPHRVTVRGTDVALLAADASPRESAAPVWDANEGGRGGGLGLATARGPGADRLVRSVRAADEAGDVVVVYLHWGEESRVAPTDPQRRLAARLARAGADVVVGAHSHVLQGAGLLDGAYVAYGLGNFAWYNSRRSETGVLTLSIAPDGEVLDDTWTPGRIPPGGGVPQRLEGPQVRAAEVQWRRLRAGTGLERPPGDDTRRLPAYTSRVSRLDDATRERMVGVSHRPAECPVPLDRLRLVEVSYVGFDGRARTGELVVAAGVSDDVVGIFRDLYRARFPIRQLRLVDDFGGDDDRSMAANNSSAYNCRPVAGTNRFSDHAFGRAVDLNPVQNPYLTAGGVLPPAGGAFADADRGVGAQPAAGAIHAGDAVVRAFTSRGWEWGGLWSEPDYQHFSAP
ncbi:CapA family protein [Nocardioides marmoraquaticus]